MKIRALIIATLALFLAACATGGGYGYGQRPYDGGYARCYDCGTVERIEEVRGARQASGAGAVLGGVIGGVLGNQVGSGSGRKAATAAGAIGGAVAGHEVEKNVQAAPAYDIFIRMDDGRRIVVNQRDLGGIRVGSYVRVDGGRARLL